MPDHAIIFKQAVTHEYRRAITRLGGKAADVNKLDAFAYATEAIRDRIHSGELELPIDDAIHAALETADSKDGRAADGILAKIARGEIGLDMWPDPMLDVVVTLGGGRRKAWKHVTADDLKAMAELRKQNTNAARRSERRFLKDIEAVFDDLVLAGSIGVMVERARKAAVA